MEKKGVCETVSEGTLFIDEIAEIPDSVQKRLLRLLQEKEFEPLGGGGVKKFKGRVISASHRDLREMVRKGAFRKDLYFRLNVLPLHLKPLRERKSDIRDLADFFLQKYETKFLTKTQGFAPDAQDWLLKYHWPGNIRELEHFIERQVLVSEGNLIHAEVGEMFDESDSLPTPSVGGNESINKFAPYMKKWEKEYFTKLLQKCQGSIEKAAQMAGLHRKTLYLKLKEFKLDKKDFQ